jgi:hypothetical protein
VKALILIFLASPAVGIVAGLVYGAAQVSPQTWDTAVIIVASSVGFNVSAHGWARIIAARHPPLPEPDKRLYQIDKAVFTGSDNLPVERWE